MSFTSVRKSDAVIRICQDNKNQRVEIVSLNSVAEDISGFMAIEKIGDDLQAVIPKRIADDISDYLEYEDDAADISEILSKERSFAIISKSGEEIPLVLKVIRTEPMWDGRPCFDLVMRDQRLQIELEKNRQSLMNNFKGYEVIDESTGLPNRVSFLKDLELISYYVKNNSAKAMIAICEPDNIAEIINKHGSENINHLTRDIGLIIKNSLRSEDAVGAITESRIAVALLDADQESGEMVLKRLKNNIYSKTFKLGEIEIKISVSFGGVIVTPNLGVDEIIKTAEKSLAIAQKQGGNTVSIYGD